MKPVGLRHDTHVSFGDVFRDVEEQARSEGSGSWFNSSIASQSFHI
jgi:hypothetical protein